MPYHVEPIPTIVRWFLDGRLTSLFGFMFSFPQPHPALICFYFSSRSFDFVLIRTSLLLCYIAMSLFLGATSVFAALDRRLATNLLSSMCAVHLNVDSTMNRI